MRILEEAITRRCFLLGSSKLAASAALPGVIFAGSAESAAPRLVVVILRGSSSAQR